MGPARCSTARLGDHRDPGADASAYAWTAAAVGSNTLSGYQLAGGEPVMAIGGFDGSDPSPTLAQFQQYVADGEIHYFLGGGQSGGLQGGPGGTQMGPAGRCGCWVQARRTGWRSES